MYVPAVWAWADLDLPWRVAVEEAWAAYAAGTIPVGAVIVDDSGNLVARGRNRIWDRSAPAPQIGATRLAHAEVNALLGLRHDGPDPRSLVIHTTSEPCPLCVGAIVMANVREIRYAAREPFAGSVAILETTAYLRSKAIKVVPPRDLTLEGVLKAIGVEFHVRAGGPRMRELVELTRSLRPDAAALGEGLAARGAWPQLRDVDAATGIAALARELESLDL